MALDMSHDASILRKAMKGLGTDDKTLINVLVKYDNQGLQALRAVYSKEIGRDLVEDIKSETSGNYEMALVGTTLSSAEWDAKCLRSFMKGMGTNEKGLIEILAHRTWPEVEAIKAAYLAMYGKTLAHDIEGDTSGFTRKFFLARVNTPRDEAEKIDPVRIQQEVASLYHGGQGRWGTDEDSFIQIICSHSNRYLQELNHAYGRAHGDTLVKAVKKEMSGWLEDGLKAMITDHDLFYAKLLEKAMVGAGTDEAVLIRVLTCRRHRLYGINNVFMDRVGKSLDAFVESEVSGNLKRVLVGVCKGC